VHDLNLLQKFSIWEFNEESSELLQMGALPPHMKKVDSKMDWAFKGSSVLVSVTNYLQAHDNCILKGDMYSICCSNQCESLLTTLEGRFGAVAAPAEAIWKALQELAPDTASGGRWAASNMGSLERLQQIAEDNDGIVPLHSVDFAYFLHFAFPRDCPIPAHDATGASTLAIPLTPEVWAEETPEEIKETQAESAPVTEAQTPTETETQEPEEATVPAQSQEAADPEAAETVQKDPLRFSYLVISMVGLVLLVGLGLLHQKSRSADAKEDDAKNSSFSIADDHSNDDKGDASENEDALVSMYDTDWTTPISEPPSPVSADSPDSSSPPSSPSVKKERTFSGAIYV